jgi:hypothetical protein
VETKVIYFETTGEANTEAVLRVAGVRARELGIKTILVASTRGETAVKALPFFPGCQVVAVSHLTGFREPNLQEFTEENRRLFESGGGVILTTTHLFGGLSMAMRKQYSTHSLGDVVANTLRLLGQGMKVVCEIAVMAADSGLARTDEDVIAIGGSSRGADTAVVIRPVSSPAFFELKVREIICKPRL